MIDIVKKNRLKALFNLRTMFLFISFLVVANCSTFDDMKKGLDHLNGQHIRTAISYLGYPNSQRVVAERKIYTWHNEDSGSYTVPNTNYNTGYIDGVPFNYTTTTNSTHNYNYACTIDLIVDDNERIISWQYNGDAGGCRSYSNRLATINPSSLPSTSTRTVPSSESPSKSPNSTTERTPKLDFSEQVYCHDPSDNSIYVQWERCTSGGSKVSKKTYHDLKERGLQIKVVKF
jgi:hypothetical protein